MRKEKKKKSKKENTHKNRRNPLQIHTYRTHYILVAAKLSSERERERERESTLEEEEDKEREKLNGGGASWRREIDFCARRTESEINT